uniref:Uncharacterized protein n=1 Tax=Anopheles culicifacies TaxID=139723 RepID=A0A182LXZ5_9DIPT
MSAERQLTMSDPLSICNPCYDGPCQPPGPRKQERITHSLNLSTIAFALLGSHVEFELTPIVSIGIFIGILTVLICIIIAIAAAFKLRATQAKQHTTTGGKRPGNLPIKEKISLPLSQSEDMYDEKNPDVVPSNEDPDYKLISANQTPTALHNSLCNSKHDIIGRTILDDSRKTYLTGVGSSFH